MKYQRNMQKFSFGFSSEIIAGTGESNKNYRLIEIDADTISTGHQSVYKGLGCITGNNSSRLLIDYKALHPEVYHEILRLLFEKNYGLQLSHLKLEFGADINSSSGTEPSVMRSADEKPDVTRGAGFILASDALKINPNLGIDLLRWGEPGWVKNAFAVSKEAGFKARYKWYADTIAEAYNSLNIRFTHISPDANETGDADAEWIIYFSEHLKSDKSMPYDCSGIKIVASDEVGTRTIAAKMVENEKLRNAVDIIGLHYTTYGDENTEKLYNEFGKEIWYSEGIAPSNITRLSIKKDMSGLSGRNSAVDTANRIINGWCHGKMTMYEFQPAVAAYYDGSCYYPKHLIRANEPWSGHYELESGFYMAMHFTRFCGENWHPVKSACLGDGEENHYIENTTANYMTLMPEDRSAFTSIITNDSNSSRYYRLIFRNFKFNERILNVIETGPPRIGKSFDSSWFRLVQKEKLDGDSFCIKVRPHSVITITTMNADFVSGTSTFPSVLTECKRLTLPYNDDFSYSFMKSDFLVKRGRAPLFTTDQGGAFEVISENGQNWLEQKITEDIIPANWRFRGTPQPLTCLGDDSWANYSVQVRIKLGEESENNYAGLGVRYNSAVACEISSNCGFAVKIFSSGIWNFLFMDVIVGSGNLENFSSESDFLLKITADSDLYTVYFNGKKLGEYKEKSALQVNGRVSLLSGYFRNRFTDLAIEPIISKNAYVTKCDALESQIKYSGDVKLNVMESYKYSNRTTADLNKGACMSVGYIGCGFALCGSVKNAVISIALDGEIIADNLKVGGSSLRQAFYRYESVGQGCHSLKVAVNEGNIILDSIMIYGDAEKPDTLNCIEEKTPVHNKRRSALKKAAAVAALGTAAVVILKKTSKRKKC